MIEWRKFRITAVAALFLLAAAPLHAAKVVEVSSYYTTLQLRDDGSVWAWRNYLGNGTTALSDVPVQVRDLSKIVAIAAGGVNLALDSEGSVWAWGENSIGQTGDGTIGGVRLRPVQVAGLTNVVKIAAGSGHSLALRSDGTVVSWGTNYAGQLGDGTKVARNVPVAVVGIPKIVAIHAGAGHSLAVAADGQLFAWGSNASGSLGTGSAAADSVVPVLVTGITNVQSVWAGWFFSLAIKRDGTVWAWGRNECAKANGSVAHENPTPIQVPGITNAVRVAAQNSSHQTLVLRGDGSVWDCGVSGVAPALVAVPSTPIVAIGAGQANAYVIDQAGRVFARGANIQGALGLGETLESALPVPVQGLDSVASVAASWMTSVALRKDGSVWSWGATGANGHRPTPQPVIGFDHPATALSAGFDYTLVLQNDGTLWALAQPPGFVPGLASSANTANGLRIPGLTGIVAMAAGNNEFIALDAAGRARLVCNGSPCANDLGLTDVTAVAAGNYHYLALRKDGSVWSIGYNQSGQLGDGTTVSSLTTPVRVSDLNNISAIYAGDKYSLAVSGDGSVFVWGLLPGAAVGTARYSLASNSVVPKPVRVPELSGSRFIAASPHLLALTTSGQTIAWGFGSAVGERDHLTPGRVPYLSGLASVAAGIDFSLGVTADGRVLAWGRNDNEQLSVPLLPDSLNNWVQVKDPAGSVYTQGAVPVAEFRNDTIGSGHYFITAYADEAIALENATFVKDWQRTGRAWRAWPDQASAPNGAKPVYRFFSSRWNSHFYTGEEAEKQALQNKNPANDPALDWALESVAFYSLPASSNCPSVSVLPRSGYLCTSGPPAVVDCPAGFYPVYRAFDQRVDPNHRFTSNWIDVYRDVRFFGFVYEGVGFCAPSSSQAGGDLHAYHTYPGDTLEPGAAMNSDFWFSNAGPGDAAGAVVVAALPAGVTWNVQCKSFNRAQCPTGLSAANLRTGVAVPALPAGGLLQLIVTGVAPAAAQTLDFASAIGPPSGAPDPFGLNNASPVTKTQVKSAPQCIVTVSPSTLSVAASGGGNEIFVDAPSACAWTVHSDQAFGAVLPAGGTGPGSFIVTMAGNAAISERLAALTVQAASGQSVELPVRQLGAPPPAPPAVCANVKLTREGEQIGANRITNFVAVQAPLPDCTWEVASQVPWISVLAATQKGSGQVDYEVQPNDGPIERRGKVAIGDRIFDVIQAGSGTVQSSENGGGGGDSGGDSSGSGSGGSDAGG